MRRLPECPLGLSESESKHRQCRRRTFVQDSLRILTCTFPNDWRGNPVKRTKVKIDMTATAEATETLFGEVNGAPLKIPVIGLVGGKGSGKTFTGSSLLPEETTEIAVEDSGVTYNFPFQKQYSLYRDVKTKNANGIPSPIECFKWFQDLLPTIDTRILFVDPITDLQAGGYQYIVENCADFGLTPSQCQSSSGLVWGALKSYLKILLGRTSQRFETLIYTSHLGTVWKGGKPVPGKVKAKGVDTFYELASLVVFLSRDADPKTGKQPAAPVGLITPPLGKSRLAVTKKLADGSYGGVPIFPPRIPKFTWTEIRKYVANPPNYDKLKAGEKAVEREMTEDEKLRLKAQMAEDQRAAEETRQQNLQSAAVAARKNADARARSAAASGSNETEPQPATPDNEESPTKRTKEDLIQVIVDQLRELGASKEQAQAAIKKRGGEKLADLDWDTLEDFRKSNWSRLTKRDIAKK